MRRSAGVEAVVEQFYDVLRGAGSAGELLSLDVTVAIGTDEKEWVTGHAGAVAGLVSRSHEAGPVTVQAGSPRGYSDGVFGWFEDRALVTFAAGESAPVRLTGVVQFENGRWRLVQFHLSIGLPNAELGLDLSTNPGAHHGEVLIESLSSRTNQPRVATTTWIRPVSAHAL